MSSHVDTISAIKDDGTIERDNGYWVSYDDRGAARAQEATNYTNAMLSVYQNNWNLAQWNRENEYNSYSAQKQRLLDAGLNPNFYNLDGSTNASQLRSADMATSQAPQLTNRAEAWRNVIGGLSDLSKQAYDVLNYRVAKAEADSRIDKNVADTNKSKAETNRIKGLMHVDEAQAKNLLASSKKFESDVELNQKKFEEIASTVGVNKAKQELLKLQKDYFAKMSDQQWDLMATEMKVNRAQAEKIVQETANELVQNAILNGNLESITLDNFSKTIKNQYVRAGCEQEYYRNTADIHQKAYGWLTPVLSLSSRLTGLGVDYETSKTMKGKDPRLSDDQYDFRNNTFDN